MTSEIPTQKKIAVIGGSGFSELSGFEAASMKTIPTPYGGVNDLVEGAFHDCKLIFVPRHGKQHQLPPHRINYRSYIWALSHLGVTHIVALNAVGGITKSMGPGTLVVPDQILDYTSGREHTFFDGGDSSGIEHVDFTEPYERQWREQLVEATCSMAESCVAVTDGVYACTQGPRLETAAEVQRLKRDGADMIGMTGMPEAVLARELNMSYACLAIVVNWAAGVGEEPLSMKAILAVLNDSSPVVTKLLSSLLRRVL